MPRLTREQRFERIETTLEANAKLQQRLEQAVMSLTQSVEKLVAASMVHPALRAALAAPLDDEPYTEEQQRRDAEIIRRIDSGEEELIPHEEIMKEFGLL